MEGTNLEFDLPVSSRKRKRIIATMTTTKTICVTKRAKTSEPQLLDEELLDFYKNMLDDPIEEEHQVNHYLLLKS